MHRHLSNPSRIGANPTEYMRVVYFWNGEPNMHCAKPGGAWMRTYPRIPPQYLFFLSMRNTRVCAILQYCSIAVSAILPMCKYVQYTQYSDVSRPPGDDRYVYPSIVHSPPVELSMIKKIPRGLLRRLETLRKCPNLQKSCFLNARY